MTEKQKVVCALQDALDGLGEVEVQYEGCVMSISNVLYDQFMQKVPEKTLDYLEQTTDDLESWIRDKLCNLSRWTSDVDAEEVFESDNPYETLAANLLGLRGRR
jgi:hypothetical protein